MTASTKLEVHDVLQCHQKMTESEPKATCIKNSEKFSHVFFKIYKPNDRHTYSSRYYASPPPGEVKKLGNLTLGPFTNSLLFCFERRDCNFVDLCGKSQKVGTHYS